MSNASALRVLRVFRAFRALKAVKHLKAIQTILASLESASEEYGIFLLLLFLFICIFCLTGMSLFAGQYQDDLCAGDYREGNWDGFYSSFILIFRVLTLDDWNTIAFGGVQCSDNNWGIFVFLLIWIILGNFMLLNLFLAILIRSFAKNKAEKTANKISKSDEESDDEADFIEDYCDNDAGDNDGDGTSPFNKARRQASRQSTLLTPEEQEKEEHVRDDVDKFIHKIVDSLASPFMKVLKPVKRALGISDDGAAKLDKITEAGQDLAETMAQSIKDVAAQGDKAHMTRRLRAMTSEIEGRKSLVDVIPISGKSCFVFGHTNRFRVVCHEVCHHHHFNNFIILCIVVSSLCLAFEDPTTKESTLTTLKRMDKIFTYIFTAEMIIKIIALGFFTTKHAYLRSSWNKLDFLIVVSSLLDIVVIAMKDIFGEIDISFFKVIRLLRVLRPLRTIKRYKNMAMVVGAIFGSFMSVVNVAALLVLIFSVFGILGMGLFGGLFKHCNDEDVILKDNCHGNFIYPYNNTEGILVNLTIDRQWINPDTNFDSFFNSLRTLFVVASLEGWYAIAEIASQVTVIGQAPAYDYEDATSGNIFYMSFFLIFICLGNFLGLGLFVGVLCDHFQHEADSGKSVFMTNEQKAWIETQKNVLFSTAVVRARAPTNSFRKFCWKLIRTQVFNFIITILILGSVILTSLNYAGESPEWKEGLVDVNKVFTWLFTIEAVLKISGDGPKIYFKRMSCCFDFFLVCGSLLDDIFDVAQGNTNILFVLRIFRVLRVSRLLRLLGPNSSLRQLMKVVLYSLPSVWNIAALLIMLYFIYAILGIALFGNTNYGCVPKADKDSSGCKFDNKIVAIDALDDLAGFVNPNFNTTFQRYAEGVNPNANFRTVGPAFATLLRVSTGENWQFIMADCAAQNEYDSPLVATLYFFSFVVFCQYITLNLFVAVLLENFNLVKSETKEQIEIKDEMNQFVEIWAVYDPDATQFINANQLPFVVTSLNKPLGVGKEASQKEIEQLLWSCDIPIYRFVEKDEEGMTTKRNRVFYKDVLYRLCKHGFGEIEANTIDHEEPEEKNEAIEKLKKERLIFSTREYIAVAKICKVIKVKQGVSLGDSFLDVIMTAAKKREREMANMALGGTFGRMDGKISMLQRLIRHLAHGASDHG